MFQDFQNFILYNVTTGIVSLIVSHNKRPALSCSISTNPDMADNVYFFFPKISVICNRVSNNLPYEQSSLLRSKAALLAGYVNNLAQ